MKGDHGKKVKDNNGMVIIEATFVFPIMFIILFSLIYMGNAFYEKAQIESIVVEKSIDGANYCADPMLETIKETGTVPSLNELKTEPYRYIFGGMNDIESKINKEVIEALEGKSMSAFANMKPKIQTKSSDISAFNNYVVYSTFSVEIEYVIEFPIKFLGADSPPILKICSHSEVPVDDTAEFIRNTDMVIDLLQGTKIGQSIGDVFGKINDFISAFTNK